MRQEEKSKIFDRQTDCDFVSGSDILLESDNYILYQNRDEGSIYHVDWDTTIRSLPTLYLHYNNRESKYIVKIFMPNRNSLTSKETTKLASLITEAAKFATDAELLLNGGIGVWEEER